MIRRAPRHPLLWLAPALAPVAGLTAAAVLDALLASFGLTSASAGGGDDGATRAAYRSVLGHDGFVGAALFSLGVAVAATVLAMAGGLAIAFRWADRPRRRVSERWLFPAHLAVPHVAWAVALLATFSSSGWLARAAAATGLIDGPAQFPHLVNDRYGIGIVAQLVTKELPFVALVVVPLHRGAQGALRQAAVLGAGRRQRFLHVYLAHVRPAAIPAGLVVFAYGLGGYEPAALLGVQRPRTLAVVALERFRDPSLATRREALVLTNLIVAACLLAAALTAVATAVAARPNRRAGRAG